MPGQPRLPRSILTYALPPDADLATVAVTVDELESAEISLDRPVRPAPPWRTAEDAEPFFGAATNLVDGKDLDVYGADAFAPAAAAALEGVAQMRRWKLARVAVSPARYHPVRGVLQSISRVSFTVSFDRAPARRADPLAADAVLDADALASSPTPRPPCVFPAAPAYKSGRLGRWGSSSDHRRHLLDSTYLYGLVAHKRAARLVVHVATETNVDGVSAATAERVKRPGARRQGRPDAEMASGQLRLHGLKYVLLRGNRIPAANELPMKEPPLPGLRHPWKDYFSVLRQLGRRRNGLSQRNQRRGNWPAASISCPKST